MTWDMKFLAEYNQEKQKKKNKPPIEQG